MRSRSSPHQISSTFLSKPSPSHQPIFQSIPSFKFETGLKGAHNFYQNLFTWRKKEDGGVAKSNDALGSPDDFDGVRRTSDIDQKELDLMRQCWMSGDLSSSSEEECGGGECVLDNLVAELLTSIEKLIDHFAHTSNRHKRTSTVLNWMAQSLSKPRETIIGERCRQLKEVCGR